MANNDLSADKIRSFLSINTKISEIIYFDSIGSTNDYAKNLIRSGSVTEDNILIVANQQTAGRGRSGHTFVSPSGTGLYMTLILNPVKKFQLVTIAAAVAVCMAIEKNFFKNGIKSKLPAIKWVNDIFMCDKNTLISKKVCGILAEAVNASLSGVGTSNKISKIIVGIGLNVRPHNFGTDLNNIAGSVFNFEDDENYDVSRAEFAAEIAGRLADFALNLDNPEIIKNYRERMIFKLEVPTPHGLVKFHSGNISYIHESPSFASVRLNVEDDNQKYYGHVIDVDDDGGLIIETLGAEAPPLSPLAGGTIITLRSGEIFEIREIKN